MGGSEKSMVGFYGGLVEGGGEQMSDLGVIASNGTKSHSVRSGSCGVSNHAADYASGGEADKKDGELDQMELEGEGEGTSAF